MARVGLSTTRAADSLSRTSGAAAAQRRAPSRAHGTSSARGARHTAPKRAQFARGGGARGAARRSVGAARRKRCRAIRDARSNPPRLSVGAQRRSWRVHAPRSRIFRTAGPISGCLARGGGARRRLKRSPIPPGAAERTACAAQRGRSPPSGSGASPRAPRRMVSSRGNFNGRSRAAWARSSQAEASLYSFT